MKDEEDEGPPPEIESLSREIAPPPELEQVVLARLHSAGLLAGRPRFASWAIAAALLVGLALGIAGGLLLAARREPEPVPVDTDALGSTPRFALFLWQGDLYRPAPEGSVGERVARYSRWVADLRAGGRAASGEKLADETRLLQPTVLDAGAGTATSATRTDPDASRGELAGYFLIEATDLDEAERIAATCPHLEYGGAIEVRRIEG